MASLLIVDDQDIVRQGIRKMLEGPSWCGPAMTTHEDGTWDGIWGERSMLYPAGDASYVEVCRKPFAGVTDLDEIKRMPFPTADWFDYSGIMAQCRDSAGYVLTAGRLHQRHRVSARRGAGALRHRRRGPDLSVYRGKAV